MKLKKSLEDYNFPPQAINIITSSGIEDLYPPQAEAIEKGLLKGNSVLMSVPTAAGKTLMAELCMLRAILFNKGRCLYIAPLKALAGEKFKDFKDKYEALGIKVGLAIGDMDSPSKNLNRYDIIIATAEKVDSLLRSKAQWLIDGLSVVVLDEIHFINDELRGPTMEILTARIKQLSPNAQLLALSATIRNAQEMADWLDAELVKSDFRPIPLKEGVYFNEEIVFNEHGTKLIREDAPDDVSKLSLDTLKGQGQVLIFVNSRRSAQAVSRQVSKSVAQTLTVEEKANLTKLAKKIAGTEANSTKICQQLADVVASGAAFHHAGLKPTQRELIEENFKKNLIKVIGCTPTLAAGVNLPARRAIIRDCKRFANGVGQVYIPTSEYKQCAGRAGRPQYDDYGEAVLVAKTNSQSSTLFDKYINAEPEPVMSKLANEASLRIHILSSISAGYVHDVNSMFEFLSHTFLHHQRLEANLMDVVGDIFDFLHREKFVEKSGYRFFPTPIGQLTSRLYLDPITTMTIRDGLNLLPNDKPASACGILHLVCCTPDGPRMNIGKKDMQDLEEFASHFNEDFLLTPENCHAIEDLYAYLATLKTTWLLMHWIEEEREDKICDQFSTGPGDVYRHVEATQWLLHATCRIAHLLQKKKLTFELERLRNRVRYGIKEELLELTQLKGVGRVRARVLFASNFTKFKDLKGVPAEQISQIKQIGSALAKDIVQQLAKF